MRLKKLNKNTLTFASWLFVGYNAILIPYIIMTAWVNGLLSSITNNDIHVIIIGEIFLAITCITLGTIYFGEDY